MTSVGITIDLFVASHRLQFDCMTLLTNVLVQRVEQRLVLDLLMHGHQNVKFVVLTDNNPLCHNSLVVLFYFMCTTYHS